MTELANITNAPGDARNIETITAEINAIRGFAQAVVLSSAVEIGRRLREAKELLPHGEWGTWLKEKVDFSQVTATRYMKLFEEYADKQGSLFGAEVNLSTLKNLSVSNALRLLAVPAEEREEFAAEHDVENLSTREMDKLIKERDEANRKLEEVARQFDESQERVQRDQVEIRDLKEKIDELESRPIDVAVQEPDPAELQKRIDTAVADAVKEAKAAAAEEKKKLKDKLSAAEQAKKTLEAEVETQKQAAADKEKQLAEQQAGIVSMEKERLEREITELKKKVAMSDATVVKVTTIFQEWGRLFDDLMRELKAIENEESRGKMLKAMRFQLGVFTEAVGT